MKNNPIEIKTFEELYGKILVEGDFLSTYLRGHLMIEFLYVKILQIKPNKYSKSIKNMTHSKMINVIYDLQYLNEYERNVLIEINKLRNQFVHNLIFFPSVLEMKILIQNAQNAFLEFFGGFSKPLKTLDKIEMINVSKIEILIDFFMEILYNLKSTYDDLFEKFHISA